MSIQTKENLRLIYNEIFGEKNDHPLVARLLAFSIDFVIFLASGPVIYFGLDAINKLTTLNQLLVDFFIWITYFTLGNSKFFKGQTIGKILLRIRVVDGQGEYLGLIRSFIRSLPIVLLINSFLIIRFITDQYDNLLIIIFHTLVIFLFGMIYFLLLSLDRPGIHDLLVYSQVIPKDRMIKIEKSIDWKLLVGFVVIVTAYVTFISVSCCNSIN